MFFNPDRWMSQLPSNLPLTALSIPGTHNSPCYFRALPSVRCQAVSVTHQLSNGIRFLDIRVQSSSNVEDNQLTIVHGAFPVSLTGSKSFKDIVLEPVQAFLASHPSETVILSVKREGTGRATDAQLSEILFRHYVAQDDGLWWADASIPTLGEARGKIVLLRRFKVHDEGIWGIDGEHWAYNASHATSGAVCVQDFCDLSLKSDMDTKIAHAKAHLACERDPELLYLNFLSASNFWRPLRYWPHRVAGEMNPCIADHLRDGGIRCSGVIVCDWVGWKGDWAIVRGVVEMNRALLDAGE